MSRSNVATAAAMSPAIGRVGELRTADGWTVPVRVADVRTVWGKVQVLAEDERGHAAWVDASRVVLVVPGLAGSLEGSELR